MIRALAFVAVLMATPLIAQDEQSPPPQGNGVQIGSGAILRGLDKVSGEVTDLELRTGESVTFGNIDVTLRECRYPSDRQASEAYAHLTILDMTGATTFFNGWMVASSPALNALDHARYDVWVLRCKQD